MFRLNQLCLWKIVTAYSINAVQVGLGVVHDHVVWLSVSF